MATTYYWLTTVEMQTGRPVSLGPFLTEAEANDEGFNKVRQYFEVFALPTRDPTLAKKLLKERQWQIGRHLESQIRARTG